MARPYSTGSISSIEGEDARYAQPSPDKSPVDGSEVSGSNSSANADASSTNAPVTDNLPEGHVLKKIASHPALNLTPPKRSRLNYSLSGPIRVRNPYIITIISTMGGLLFGFASANLNAYTGTDNYNDYFNSPNAVDGAGISASFPGGAFIGSLISSFVADKAGRRAMIQWLTWFWMVGCAIQCACNNRASLCWGRIIAGVAVGIASANVPLYLAELSPERLRGRLVSCFQESVTVGILIMYFITYGCSKIHGPSSFRLGWGLQMVPGFIMFLGSTCLTESPRWLAKMGRWEECVEVLSFLRNRDPESLDIQTEVNEMADVVSAESGVDTTFFDLFRGISLRRTICAVSAQMYQQLVGSNILLYFSSPLISMTGHEHDKFRFTVILFALLVGMTLPSILFMDKCSRRWLFLGGGLWMMACMAVLAGLFGARSVRTPKQGLYGDPTIQMTLNDKPVAKAALAMTYLYFAGYSFTWGPTPWVYLAEIFPSNQRGYGNGLGSGVNWLFNFAVTIATPPGFHNITWKMYVIFAVLAFVAIIHIFIEFPETHGKTLEDMAEVFENKELAYRTDPIYVAFMRWRGKEHKLPAYLQSDSKEKGEGQHVEKVESRTPSVHID